MRALCFGDVLRSGTLGKAIGCVAPLGKIHLTLTSETAKMAPIAQITPIPIHLRERVGQKIVVSVTITNEAAANLPLGISSIEITPSNAGFSNTHECDTALLQPGQSCRLTVAFAPSTTGPQEATLVVTNNGADSSQTVLLSGNGLAAR